MTEIYLTLAHYLYILWKTYIECSRSIFKMSQSVLRLFVNNAINFMILFLPLFFPTSRNLNNLNKQSCKKK